MITLHKYPEFPGNAQNTIIFSRNKAGNPALAEINLFKNMQLFFEAILLSQRHQKKSALNLNTEDITAQNVSVFGVFLARIFPHLD